MNPNDSRVRNVCHSEFLFIGYSNAVASGNTIKKGLDVIAANSVQYLLSVRMEPGHNALTMIAHLELDRKHAMRERAFPTIDPPGPATGVMPQLGSRMNNGNQL